ncbi:hypothetical protein ACQ4PT_028769 [Festuca glaucescens]
MANSTKLLAVAALLATASLGAVLLSSTHGAGDGNGNGVPWVSASSSSILTTLPFSPMDVLPLLPRRVSMAALRALRGASDIFPVFVGAATAVPEADGAASSGVVGWKGACFYENEAWLEFNNDSGTAYGGGTVHIKVRRTVLAASAAIQRKIDCCLVFFSKSHRPNTVDHELKDANILSFGKKKFCFCFFPD